MEKDHHLAAALSRARVKMIAPKVFNVPELLENILINMVPPPSDHDSLTPSQRRDLAALVRFRRVNSAFKATIDRSPELKRRLEGRWTKRLAVGEWERNRIEWHAKAGEPMCEKEKLCARCRFVRACGPAEGRRELKYKKWARRGLLG